MIEILKYARKIIDRGGRVFVYGCGEIGTLMADFLHYYKINISGYIVSDGCIRQNNVKGLQVYEISEIPSFENDGIIIAVGFLYYNEITPEIVRHNCENLYFVKHTEIYAAKVMKKIREFNINLDAPILDFNVFKFPNLFHFAEKEMNDLELYEMLSQFQDLVYPYLNDYSEVVEGVYEYSNVKLNKGDIVLDCGTNMGLFSARAAALGCKVFSFEPSPLPIKYLKYVKEIYNDNITIAPYALAEKEGKSLFYVTNNNIGAGNLIGKTHGNADTIEVSVTTIDHFLVENQINRVDFIKADIEGAERLMLKGAKETLRKYSPKLSLCSYHLFDDISVMTDLILDANPDYKIKYAWQKMYAWVE